MVSQKQEEVLAKQPIGCLVGLMRENPIPVGYLWFDSGRHWFTYLPEYLAADNPAPLHPVDLPLEHGLFMSRGEWFDGPLAIFSRCLPGVGSQKVITALSRDAYPQFTEDAFNSPVGQLAFASLMSGKEGVNGLFFSPGEWPDETILDAERHAWDHHSFVIPHDSRKRLIDAGVPEWVAAKPHQIRCVPNDGIGIKIKGREGYALVGLNDAQQQAHRVESAYLKVAKSCGIKVANFCLLFADQATLFWRDVRQGVRASLQGAGPEDIAQKATDLVMCHNIDLVEVFRRLCFVILSGFCGQAYGDMMLIDLPSDHHPQELLESTWQLAPVNGLTIAQTEVVESNAMERCAHLGRILGISDELSERVLQEVTSVLSGWRGIARNEGLSNEEAEQFKPRILFTDGNENTVAKPFRQRRKERVLVS